MNTMEENYIFLIGWQPTEADFAQLLRDRTFVDYFNVFMNLPIFSQRALFKISDNSFEFDPPIKRTQYHIDQCQVRKWIMDERMPYFLQSDLYLEYTLCRHLFTAVRRDTEDAQEIKDYQTCIRSCVGMVMGMRMFQASVENSPGRHVIDFWIEAERYRRIPECDKVSRRRKFRDIQTKYFKTDCLFSLADNMKWQVITEAGTCDADDGTILTNEANLARRLPSDIYDTCSLYREENFLRLQSLVLMVIKEYWLPRYILHCKRMDDAHTKSAQMGSFPNITLCSPPNMKELSKIKDVNLAVKIAEGNKLKRLTANANSMKSVRSLRWQSMFPDDPVPGDLLENPGEVVTMHDDGHVTIDPLASESMNFILERYFQDSSTDSTPESSRPASTMPATMEGDTADLGLSYHPETNELIQKIYKAEKANRTVALTAENLAIHQNMISLNDRKSPKLPQLRSSGILIRQKKIGTRSNKRDKLHRPSTAASSRNICLPDIDHSTYLVHRGSHDVFRKETLCVMEPSYQFKNTAAGFYRFDNRVYVNAVASDMAAGQPFLIHLIQNEPQNVRYLEFWNDSQVYLTIIQSRVRYSENPNYATLANRKARALVKDYIQQSGKKHIGLPTALTAMLVRMLHEGKGHDLLRNAQDLAAKAMYKEWKSFVNEDSTKFLMTCMVYRAERLTRRGSTIPAGPPPAVSLSSGTSNPPASDKVTKKVKDKDKVDALKPTSWTQCHYGGLKERTSVRALELAMAVRRVGTEGLPIYEQPLSAVQGYFIYDDLRGDDGSLTMQPPIRMKKDDFIKNLITLSAKRTRQHPVSISRMRVTRETDAEVVNESSQAQNVTKSEIPVYLKPIKRNGKIYYRRNKPRSFSDIWNNSVQLEFFKRFLAHHGADTDLNFALAIEDLKRCKEVKARLVRINHLKRKYFSRTKDAQQLQCTADIIEDVVQTTKVSLPMLISAQACVMRDLEAKWFQLYLDSFRETERKVHSAASSNERSWGKQNTRKLWQRFLRTIVRFRKGILNRGTSELFQDYLKAEIKKENEKARLNAEPKTPTTARKIIHNKVVLVDKLVCDLRFLVEVEKYRELCFDAFEAAKTGIFRPGDEEIIEKKAKTIIDCFIDSELPPRVQVNISQEIADEIMKNFNNKIIECGLFHDAVISIYVVQGYLWKKFCKYRFGQLANVLSLFDTTKTEEKEEERNKTPDYVNIGVEDIDKTTGGHDEDNPRLMFSLANGLRLNIPMPRHLPHFHRRNTNRSNMFFGGSNASMFQSRNALFSSRMSVRKQSMTTTRQMSQISATTAGRRLSRPGLDALAQRRGSQPTHVQLDANAPHNEKTEIVHLTVDPT